MGCVWGEGGDMVYSVGQKGPTLHRLPTYKSVRARRFTNVLLAMLVMLLPPKDLWMTAD